MKYRLVLSENARRELKKLDKQSALLLIGWMRKNLDGIENPRAKGKVLTGNYKNAWRYRVGNYRIIAEIEDEKIVVIVLKIGHRREVYR